MAKKEITEIQDAAVQDEPIVPMPDMTFAQDYKSYSKGTVDALDEYVQRELQRLKDEGAPVMTSVLACRNHLPKTRALMILSSDPSYSSFRLKLVPGVIPPDRDYNGALVPVTKRGKVLAAKVGLTSHFDKRALGDPRIASDKYGAAISRSNETIAKRQYMSPVGRYAHVEIWHDKVTTLDFDNAVAVLTRYGYGVGDDQSFWFVQEV